MRLSRLIPSRHTLLACAAGGVATLSFAPFGWWPLQIVMLALLFWLVARCTSSRQATTLGWAFGFGWMLCGFYWLFISMHRYGGLPAPMAAAAVALLALALAILPAAAMGLAHRLQHSGASRAAVLLGAMPALWLFSEWLRGWIFTGFPWVASGYAHTSSALTGYAAVLGVYGIGWLAALLAGCLVLRNRRALALALLVVATGLGLKQVEWTHPHGQMISVRLLQGNVPQEMKFVSGRVLESLRLYHELITNEPADLVATPETALPLLAHRLPPDYLPRLQQFANASGSHIALGVPVSDAPQSYANSVLGISPAVGKDGLQALYRYDKHHLVPFGEFIPPGARWFVDMMNIPLGDFSRGATLQAPFAVKDQRVLPNVCYEDLFGEEIADQLAAAYFAGQLPATILLNVSNIAWFGDTIALPQHLQISQMRSLETGRPMLRATNTGMTAVIDPRGQVTASLAPYTRGSLTAQVQGMQGWTPYMLGGNVPAITLALLMLLLAWRSARHSRVSVALKTR